MNCIRHFVNVIGAFAKCYSECVAHFCIHFIMDEECEFERLHAVLCTREQWQCKGIYLLCVSECRWIEMRRSKKFVFVDLRSVGCSRSTETFHAILISRICSVLHN